MVYSFGSSDSYTFESDVLNRTKCDVHVFDPTLRPSVQRQREVSLNRGYRKQRIWWHAWGLGGQDDDDVRCDSASRDNPN